MALNGGAEWGALSVDKRDVLIRVKGLSKTFGNTCALDNVDLTVRSGERICIIGPSGSGKSTLLRCLNFLEEPDAGSVLLAGTPVLGAVDELGRRNRVRRAQIMRLRSSVGMVFQSFNLWRHMTVLQNIVEAPRRVKGLSRAAATARASNLLAQVGLQTPERVSVAAIGWSATARGDRAGAGDGTKRHAVRRTDLVAGPRAGG